jgi:hypothetical protein
MVDEELFAQHRAAIVRCLERAAVLKPGMQDRIRRVVFLRDDEEAARKQIFETAAWEVGESFLGAFKAADDELEPEQVQRLETLIDSRLAQWPRLRLQDELKAGLNADGYGVTSISAMGVLPDGTEVRGGGVELADLVRKLLVFVTNEIDKDTAEAMLRVVFARLRARKESGESDDVAFVSIFGPDGASVLLLVPVPERQIDQPITG